MFFDFPICESLSSQNFLIFFDLFSLSTETFKEALFSAESLFFLDFSLYLDVIPKNRSRKLRLRYLSTDFSEFIPTYRKCHNLVRTQVEIISDPNYLVRILFER